MKNGSALQDAVRKEWASDPMRGRYSVPVALLDHGLLRPVHAVRSTLIVMQRETKSWKMPAFAFAYMTALAYVGAFVTFQVGRLIVDAM